jgi:hypothetical protein
MTPDGKELMPYDRPRHPSRVPRLLIDPDAVAARLETLSGTPLCDSCRAAIVPVTADTATLLTEAIRLHDALAVTRLESANRLAAMRAALHTDREGDPWATLTRSPISATKSLTPARSGGGAFDACP